MMMFLWRMIANDPTCWYLWQNYGGSLY